MPRKLAIALFAAWIAATAAQQLLAQEPKSAHAPLPTVVPGGRASVGIALEGGGALGIAHIGVLEWMEDHHIPVDRISGTSMGSLIGALYSTGSTPAQLRALATGNVFLGIFTLQTPYVDSSFRRRQDRHELPQAIVLGLKHGPALRNALLSDRGVNDFLSTELFAYNLADFDFDNMPIPFRCVATDLTTLEPLTFSGGSLARAVRASISIPGVFPPIKDDRGHFMADGGILDNLPVDVLKNDLHADTLIAVHLQDAPIAAADTGSIVGVLNRAFSAGIVNNVERSKLLADVVVDVPVGSYSTTDYNKGGQLIREGYLAAEAVSGKLMRYALNDADWAAYLAARRKRQRIPSSPLRQVKVEDASLAEERQVLQEMKPLVGKPISAERTLDALKPVQSNGGVTATFEVFAPESSAAVAPAANADLDSGVVVQMHRDSIGPPYLLVGPEVAASTSNITRGEVTLRVIDQNLGGFGSELRANARIGYLTSADAEYYRLIAPGGYFIEPRAGLLREPVYLWANQKRIAERLQQNLEAGVEVGRTFSKNLQISADWRAADTHWSLTTGTGGGPYLSGTAQTGLLHIKIDEADAASISPNGFRLSASAGSLYHAVGSNNAPLVNLNFTRTHSWHPENIFGISAEVNSYLRANVAEPYRFTLGGPLRLSASSFEEFRGTDTYLVRTGLMHRIAALPTGLGQGLYAVAGYEAGEIWSPEARAILRQDVSTGLIANTPLGVITIGGAVGDAGHRKLFVTLGRWF